MANVCIIPARGGSRRIPRKNIRMFHGKPIIAYSIEAAKASGLFSHVFVSTDDMEIAYIAHDCGAWPLLRSSRFAQDEVGTQEVMANVLMTLSKPFQDEMRDRMVTAGLCGTRETTVQIAPFDYACCIYATAPMMTAEDLLRAREWLNYSKGEGYAHIPGWFYFAKTQTFLSGVPVEESAPMTAPKNRYIDINTPEYWSRAERMYAALHPEAA